MEFGVLGPVELVVDGRQRGLGGPKQRAVLALLVAHAGRPVSTESLIDGVYGDAASDRARRSIHTFVSNLRGEVGDAIERHGDGYVFAAERTTVDAFRFAELTAEAGEVSDPAAAGGLLRRALSLWRGHPYADVDGGPALRAEITRLNEERLAAIEARVDADLEAGHHREVIGELESLTAEYPLQERFRAQQMLALYRAGRQAEALRAYERTRSYLVAELGLDPSPELRDLEQRILDQDPELGAASRPAISRLAVLVADVDDPHALGALAPADRQSVMARQSEIIDAAVAAHDGDVIAHRGSAVYATFADAGSAAATADEMLRRLGVGDPQSLRFRIAIAVGEVESSNGEVSGPPISRAVALVGAAHGGQILLSSEAQAAIADDGAGWLIRGLGAHSIDGLADDEVVHQLVVEGIPVDFTSLRTEELPPALPLPASGVPGYELREEVGRGAFGVVHRAYQPSVGRQVAVKIIRPEFANSAEFIRRFEVEAQLVARLEHPYIVPLYDYWRTPDGAFLVMRWFSGVTLESRLESGPMAVAEASVLLSQVGPALAYAHRHRVVHGDIKASNILLDEDGNAYLTDFGVAVEGGNESGDVAGLGELLALCLPEADGAVRDVISRATSGAYADVAALLEAWEMAVGGVDVGVEALRFTPTRNPYKGLRAFGESDVGDFHGRSDEIAQLTAAVSDRRLVAVVGPSGIGKSSVVRAGLIPALRKGAIAGSDQWLITDLVPGPYPLEELTSALLRVAAARPVDLESELRRDARGLVTAARRYLPVGAELFLLIDQFEELFTLVADEAERLAFLDLLRAAVTDERSPIRVVVTMRADYFDRPLRFGDFGELLRESTVPLAAPTGDELAEIIELPASGVGVRYETGLVDRIASDVKDQPGALPLLEFSLTGLFEDRGSDVLTLESYESSGGVLGALGRRAEETYLGLDTAAQADARQVFLRLVNVSESGRDTRRRVRRSELRRLAADDSTVLAAFGAHRLLTFDRDSVTRGPTVEVAHEAILAEWPRLAGWIDDQREDLLLQGRLATAIEDWEAADRANTYLLTSGRLTQHQAWTADTDLSLTSVELQFLEASRKAENERLARTQRVRRRVLGGIVVAAVIGLLLAVAALVARSDAQSQAALAREQASIAKANEDAASRSAAAAEDSAATADAQRKAAEDQRSAAEAAREVAEGNGLVASASAVIDEDPDLSLLLALAGASALDGDPQAMAVLREAMAESHTIYTYTSPLEGSVRETYGDLSPDGTTVVIASNPSARVEMREVETGRLVWDLQVDTPYPADVETRARFINDGTEVAIQVLRRRTPEQGLAPILVEPVLIPSGIHVVDAETGARLRRYQVSRCGSVLKVSNPSDSFALLRTPSRVWVEANGCGEDASNRISWDFVRLDLNTGESAVIAADVGGGEDPEVALDYSGRLALIQRMSAGINVVDLDSGKTLMTAPDTPVHAAAVSRDGSMVVFGGKNEQTGRSLYVYEVASGTRLAKLSGHAGSTAGAWFSADGQRLYTAGGDGSVRIWDPREGTLIETIRSGQAFKTQLGFSSDEKRIAIFGASDTVTVVSLDPADTADAGVLEVEDCEPPRFHLTGGLDVRDNRALVNAGCRDGAVRGYVFDLADQSQISEGPLTDGQDLGFSPDGSWVAGHEVFPATETAGDRIGTIVATNLETRATVAMDGLCVWENPDLVGPGCGEPPYEPYPAYNWDVKYSANGQMLAMGAFIGGYGQVWDANTGRSLMVERFFEGAFSPRSDRLITMLPDEGALRVWDVSDFTEIASRTLTGDDAWLANWAFSPDGNTLVAAVWAALGRSDIVFFDATTLAETRRIRDTHEAGIRHLVVSTDGSMLATAGQAGFAKVWDFTTGELLHTIRVAVDDRVQAVAFANDDANLLASVPGGPVSIFALDAKDVLESARARLTRGFTDLECEQYFENRQCPSLEDMRTG